MKRKSVVAASIVATLTSAYIANVWWAQGAPVRVAYHAIKSVQSDDWKGLYNLGLKEEIDSNGWSATDFEKFAAALSQHLTARDQQGRIVEVSPTSSGGAPQWAVRNERHFQWVLPVPNGMAKTKDSIINVVTMRDASGEWRVMAGEMVRDLNRAKRDGVDDVIVSLHAALAEAGLKRYVDFPSGDVISVARLERVMKGELKWTEIWQTAWDYNQGGA